MGPISSGDLPPQLPAGMREVFHGIRYLSTHLETPRPGQTHYDLMCFSKIRTKSTHELLRLGFPPLSFGGGAEASLLTPPTAAFELEALRLAALLYLHCGLHMFIPFSTARPAVMGGLKAQFFALLSHFDELAPRELNAVMEQRATLTWALVVGSQLAETDTEEALFAKLIAKMVEGQGVEDWQGMEQRLRRICWVKMLGTVERKRVWERVRRGGW